MKAMVGVYQASFTVRLVSTVACSLIAASAFASTFAPTFPTDDALPDVDPSREWLGAEYADVVFARFRHEYPNIPLVIDHKDIASFAADRDERLQLSEVSRQALETYRKSNQPIPKAAVNSLKTAFGQPMTILLRNLEFGLPIEVNPTRDDHPVALKLWILQQPENSIYPDDLMVEALRLRNGHVLAAWALAWNVIRDNWIMASTRNYTELRSRFASLTGERHLWQGAARYVVLPENARTEGLSTTISPGQDKPSRKTSMTKRYLRMTISKRGDEFSYLYHRIGVELFTMIAAKKFGFVNLGWLLGKAGAMGEFTKYAQTAGLRTENKKRVGNDLAAADSGARLFSLVSGTDSVGRVALEGPRAYLRSNPEKYGSSYQLPAGVPVHYFGSSVDPKFWAPSMSVEELYMRFHHAVYYDVISLHPVVLATGEESERLHRGLADYIEQGAGNRELNKLIRLFRSGVYGEPSSKDVDGDIEIHLSSNQEFLDAYGENKFKFTAAAQKLDRHLDKVIAVADRVERGAAIDLRIDAADRSSKSVVRRACELVFRE